MREFLGKHLKVIGGAVAIGLGISAALGVAAVQENDGSIHACVITIAGAGGPGEPASGANLHIIDPASQNPASNTCEANQMPLTINGRGLQGPAGAAGAAGGSPDDCGAAIGHLTLSGNPLISTDVCSASQVKGSTAAGRTKGQVTFADVVITKTLDKSSPSLSQAAVKGKIFKMAKLEIFSPAKTIKLSNVMISSYQVGLGLQKPLETLTLVAVSKKGS